ncbi:MAG: hypothetical protein ACOC14_02525, partial [Bacillota bacterium]
MNKQQEEFLNTLEDALRYVKRERKLERSTLNATNKKKELKNKKREIEKELNKKRKEVEKKIPRLFMQSIGQTILSTHFPPRLSPHRNYNISDDFLDDRGIGYSPTDSEWSDDLTFDSIIHKKNRLVKRTKNVSDFIALTFVGLPSILLLLNFLTSFVSNNAPLFSNHNHFLGFLHFENIEILFIVPALLFLSIVVIKTIVSSLSRPARKILEGKFSHYDTKYSELITDWTKFFVPPLKWGMIFSGIYILLSFLLLQFDNNLPLYSVVSDNLVYLGILSVWTLLFILVLYPMNFLVSLPTELLAYKKLDRIKIQREKTKEAESKFANYQRDQIKKLEGIARKKVEYLKKKPRYQKYYDNKKKEFEESIEPLKTDVQKAETQIKRYETNIKNYKNERQSLRKKIQNHDMVPKKYASPEILQKLVEYARENRATNFQEAINLYLKEKGEKEFRDKMIKKEN